jgi:hypothetical protein
MLEILACVTPCTNQDFRSLVDHILRHIGELSGLVVVLLDWDDKRQQMIRRFTDLKIPVLVFVIVDADDRRTLSPGPLQDTPQRLIALPAGDMQAALDRVNRNGH